MNQLSNIISTIVSNNDQDSLAKGEHGNQDQQKEIRNLERLAHLLDDHFRLPGTSFRFGADSLVGLIPVAGDVSTAVLSTYLIARARKLGVRRRTQWRMASNVLVDVVIGAIPLLGDLFDFGWKANKRNVHLMLKELEHYTPQGNGQRKEK